MYVPQQNEEPQLNQAVLYQDLTELIKIFKAILSSCESISGYISRGEQCEQQVIFLRKVLEGKQKIVNRYHYEVHEESPHKNTFFRFVSRINETIELYKNRTYKHNLYGKFQEFVLKLENVVKSYITYRNIGKIFGKILSYSLKFCTNLQSISKTLGKQGVQQIFHQQAKETAEFQHQNHTKNIQFNNTQTNFHKVMTGLNKRFKTMSCLDIDYNFFKGGYYLAKNQNNDLFKDMFFRNSQIYRLINIYSREFQDYLKRKDRQIVRKNRFKQEKILKNAHSIGFKTYNQFNKTVEVTKILQTQQNSQQPLKRDSMPQIIQSTKQKRQKQILNTQSNFMQVNNRKTSCHINNIYLTLNKVHLKTENHKFTKNNIRQKNKYYSILNSQKFSLKSSKFAQTEVTGTRPILQIRQLDYKNMQMKFQQFSNNNESLISIKNQTITKPQTQSKQKDPTKTSRRSIRISCVSKKNSINSSVVRSQILQKCQDFGIPEHQILQQQLLH